LGKERKFVRILRWLLSAYFMISSLAWFAVLFRLINDPALRLAPLRGVLLDASVMIVAIIFGMGGWMPWRHGNSSGVRDRAWPLTASLASLLIFSWIAIQGSYFGGAGAFGMTERVFAYPQLIGVVGLFVFSRKKGADDTRSV
jgi:hypothetical protein